MIRRFDIVKIKSVERVIWMSGPAGRPASPKGCWSVIMGVGDDELLLAKDETVIRIFKDDVVKVADYNLVDTLDMIQKVRSLEDLDKFIKLEKENGKGS